VTPKPVGREAKKHETRRALGFAAFELAGERGLHGFVVEDVTDRVGVSRRTFFNYFNRKEEAVVAVGGFVFDDALTELRDRPADEALFDALRAVVTVITTPENLVLITRSSALGKQYPELVPYELAIREHMVTTAHAVLAERMTPEQRSSFYPLALVHAVFAVMATALGCAGESPGMDVAALIDEAFHYLRAGFDPQTSG
jgi:AcrR family transcriptional regulator